MYFCYNYCLSTYLDWFPTYLHQYRGYDLKRMGFYASLPLLAGTVGDLAGGWLSDVLLRAHVEREAIAPRGGGRRISSRRRRHHSRHAHRRSQTCVAWSCIAFFGLEITVGVSWAIPLDIGGDCAGSVSSVMNMCGNIGGAISPTALAYLVKAYGWNVPFLVASALCAIGAVLYYSEDRREPPIELA